MRIKTSVAQFDPEQYSAVVFGEPESEEETSAILSIRWGDSGVVGDYCAPSGSRVLFIYPCESEESAKEYAEGVAARILQVVDDEVGMQALGDSHVDVGIEVEKINAAREEIQQVVIKEDDCKG